MLLSTNDPGRMPHWVAALGIAWFLTAVILFAATGLQRRLVTGVPSINRLLNELHRRRVFRALAYYVVSGWLLLQAADVLFPAWEIPDSGIRYVLYALVLGFPVALIFAWHYDIGPTGIHRTNVGGDGEVQPLGGRDFLLLGALLLVLGAIVYGVLKDAERGVEPADTWIVEEPAATETGPPVVAVLPFTTAGASDGQGDGEGGGAANGDDSLLFADGVHDDLLTQLSRLGSLRVISRSSVMTYRDATRNIRQIGAELGATVILEGLVRVSGEQIRISAKLIDARSDETLWSESFDRSLTTANLFDVQADIARAISAALDAELSQAEERELSVVPTSNMAAYRAFKQVTGGAGSSLGRPEFAASMERAVELDPNFVQAWAELAGTYAYVSRSPDVDRETMLQRAEAALAQIERLAPDSVEHLYAQSYYLYYALSEYEDALALADRAIERNPSGLRLWQLKSWIERRLGLWEQRLDTMQRLIMLDPLSERRRWSLAYQLFQMHRYDEAWAQLGAPSPEAIPADSHQTRRIAALLRHRDAESFEAFLDGYRSDLQFEGLDDRAMLRTQVYRWHLAFISRNYEEALRIAESTPPYPGWEQLPLTSQAALSMPVLWAMGDGLRLQAVVDEAQDRFERLKADRPDIVSNPIFLQDLAMLALFRGDEEEALALLRRWEVASLGEWTQRIQFREAVCGLYGIMARTSDAVACLRTGFEEPSEMVPWVTPHEPVFDPIRDTPEFQALLADLEARFGSGG